METTRENKSIRIPDIIRSKTPPEHRNSLFYTTSDSSFERMENLCEMLDSGDENTPDFDNTLDEVNYLLAMNEKTKKMAGKDVSWGIFEISSYSQQLSTTTSTPIRPSQQQANKSSVKKTNSGMLSPIFINQQKREVTPMKRIKNQSEYLSVSSLYTITSPNKSSSSRK